MNSGLELFARWMRFYRLEIGMPPPGPHLVETRWRQKSDADRAAWDRLAADLTTTEVKT